MCRYCQNTHDLDWLEMYQALKNIQRTIKQRDPQGAAPREIFLTERLKKLVDVVLAAVDTPRPEEFSKDTWHDWPASDVLEAAARAELSLVPG